MRRHSCVIVGGGPAGIATALFLLDAAPGLRGRVVVLEKERYPREKICAGAVGDRADRLLATIGVSVDVPSARIGALAFRTMGGARVVREPGAGRVVRRAEFDHALADVARRRGIQIREGVRATALDITSSGVLVRTTVGDIDSDVVVGADGVGSLVRREAAFERTPYVAQAIEVDTEPAPGDLPRDVLSFDVSRRDLRGYCWDFPTIVDGRELVSRGVYSLGLRDGERQPDVESVLAQELAGRGLSLSSYTKRRYAERGFHRGTPVVRPRVLLVGEAAGIDPVTGEGIAQAIGYGAAAGRYLARKLADGDLSFGDWPSWVRGSSVGRDLLIRSAVVGLVYGRQRPLVERFLLDTPGFLRLGLQHFAGHRWSRRSVIRASAAVLGATVRGALGRAGLQPRGGAR
jgi:flavin-dependent dehydrogenase